MIPRKILSFLNISGNYILLVKGDPGVGKTIFSLEALKSLKNYKGIYFSTRDSIDAVKTQLPWIKELADGLLFIDAVRPSQFISKSIPANKAIELSTLPRFLKSLYVELITLKKENKDEHVIVIIDSLDALSLALDVDKVELLQQIKNMMITVNAKGIVTTECKNVTQVDFIADGVILLSKQKYDNRLLRTLVFEKLRGVEISRNTCVFSLEHGHFYTFQDNPNVPIGHKAAYQTIIDAIKQYEYLTESINIALKNQQTIYKHISDDTCFLFVYELDIPGHIKGFVHGAHIINALQNNRHVFYMPSKSVEPRFIYNAFIVTLRDNEKIAEHIHIISLFDECINMGNAIGKNTLNLESFINNIISEVSKYTNKGEKVLVSLDIDHIATYFDTLADEKKLMKALTNLVSFTRKTNSLCIIKTYKRKPLVNELEVLTDASMYVFSLSGQFFIYGTKPYTGIYGIVFERNEEGIYSVFFRRIV